MSDHSYMVLINGINDLRSASVSLIDLNVTTQYRDISVTNGEVCGTACTVSALTLMLTHYDVSRHWRCNAHSLRRVGVEVWYNGFIMRDTNTVAFQRPATRSCINYAPE